MKPEILLKAYVQYQSEDAFRDLVVATLDDVYSTSLRIAHGAPQLAEEIALSTYLELVRRAPELGNDVVLASWLREQTCKLAVKILRAEDRNIDWAVMKREKDALSTTADLPPAPPGVAIRICQSIFWSAAWRKGPGFFTFRLWQPTWIRPLHAGGVAFCMVLIIVCWSMPFHRQNPIIRSEGLQFTPASFAQLASPQEGGPPKPNHMANTDAGTELNKK